MPPKKGLELDVTKNNEYEDLTLIQLRAHVMKVPGKEERRLQVTILYEVPFTEMDEYEDDVNTCLEDALDALRSYGAAVITKVEVVKP